jgi:hypothetical protein
MGYNVFVSHSMRQDDLAIVYETARQASLRGISCYIAERDWQFGKSLPEKIEKAIRASDCLVAFWTQGGAYSAYVNQEIGFARACGITRILIVERGVPIKGFEIGKEYIELDRWNPLQAIALLNEYLSRLKLVKEQRQIAAAFLLGIIALLALIPGGKR